MAKRLIPDPLARRHLLEGDLERGRALRIAEAYLAEERTVEALGFLAKAGARERIEALRDRAVEGGDVFLLREAAAALGEEPGTERWRRLAEAARAGGKEAYAAEALRQAELAEEG